MALAMLYGLEPRNCGRKGTTLFRTYDARMPGEEGQKLVRHVACYTITYCSPSKP